MIGKVLNGRYEIKKQVGTGGMADVYMAIDRLLGRTVAVKVLHPQFSRDPVYVERFRQEAQAAANISHQNIVNVHDWGVEGELHYIVMEYVEGKNLKDIILDSAPLMPERAVEIAISICMALEAAHSHRIVHRDIKPQNVIVTKDNQIKVMDFGIARTSGGSSITQTGTIIGTAQYISPEQAQGRSADPRSDLYSLGIVLYEMLTGKVPFDGETPVAIAYKHVREDPLPPSMLNPDISPELEAIVLKALAKNPQNRYQNATEMRADLERSLEGTPVYATPVLPAEEKAQEQTRVYPAVPVSTRGRSRRWPWVVLVAVALIAIAFGIWGVLRGTSAITVPDLTGKTEAEAKKILADAGLLLGTVTRDYSETIPEGKIISQNPKAGSKITKNMKIDIVVSRGAPLISVPDCRGLSLDEAKAKLQSEGLEVGNVTEEFSSSQPAGKISSQNPAPGSDVRKGSKVDLALSKGPEMVSVPRLIGMNKEAATKLLEQKGLTANIEEVVTSEHPEGAVFEQTPKEGESVPKGSTVTIRVAIRPKKVSVPSVIGKTFKQAKEILLNAKLTIGYEGSPTENTTVKSQNPVPGTMVDEGTEVRLEF